MTDETQSSETPPRGPEAEEPPSRAPELALRFYGTLLFLSLLLSYLLLEPVHELGADWRSQFSYLLMLALGLCMTFAVDSFLERTWLQLLLAGSAAASLMLCVAGALFTSITSTPLSAGLAQLTAGGSPLDALAESELGGLAFAVAGLLPLSFMCGAFLRRALPRSSVRGRWLWVGPGLSLLLLGVFVLEQAHAQSTSSAYFLRSHHLPAYWQLFERGIEPEVIRIQAPRSSDERARELSSIGPAGNPKHVLIIGLESVRPDAIRPDHAPNLSKLRDASLRLSNARSVSIYTALTWTSIMLDRPAVSALRDLQRPPTGQPAWPLAVLAAAGYRNHLAFSGSLIWGDEAERRLRGDASDVVPHLTYHPREQLHRHLSDDEVTATTVRWIEEADRARPNLFLLQLDSTHWNYHFPPEHAVESAYPEEVDPRSLTRQPDLDLVRNRYVNAVHHVDAKVGQVLDALRRRGMLSDTAVVVLSDHGEGFEVGRAGHIALCADSERIPFFFCLPGVPAAEISDLVDQRQLWPTLCEYLAIPGVRAETFQTRSIWKSPKRTAAFSTAFYWGDLTFAEGVLRFRVELDQDQVSLYPIASVGPNGRSRGDFEASIEALPWREALRDLNRSGAR
ncbi:MAG: sulfatase-like hydrolase/transferase [Planctomycetes bacterium]|nr:sulfatase-like hydrolase/transferase [Planctomycetota bacterium]